MKTINETVGCLKFPDGVIRKETTASGAFSYIANYVRLQALEVVIGNDKVLVGQKVYVSAKDYTQPWAKTTYKFDVGGKEQEIIFVPLTSVLMVD